MPRESNGQRSLTGYGPLGRTESDTTEATLQDCTHILIYEAYFFSSVAQLYPTLCDLKDCSTPAFPVHHQLPEFTYSPDSLITCPIFSVSGCLLSPPKMYCCCCIVPRSCSTLCDPMNCSQPGSSVHGFLQAKLLE